jgi:hypothetical protein
MSVRILWPDRRRAWHDRLAASLGPIEGDVVVDLTESGAAPGAGPLLRPLYDGLPDSSLLAWPAAAARMPLSRDRR